MKVWHWLLILVVFMYLAGRSGFEGSGTMSISDWTDSLKKGPAIGDTTIPYWLIGLGAITLFLFVLPSPKGAVSTETLTKEVKFFPISK